MKAQHFYAIPSEESRVFLARDAASVTLTEAFTELEKLQPDTLARSHTLLRLRAKAYAAAQKHNVRAAHTFLRAIHEQLTT